MKRKLKKRWLILLAVMMALLADYINGVRNKKILVMALREEANVIVSGEWGMFTLTTMPSLSKANEDFRQIDGISLVLNESGTYTLTLSDEAMAIVRRGGSRLFLSDPTYFPTDFEPNFTTNTVSGKYNIRVDDGGFFLIFDKQLGSSTLCRNYIGLDGNFFFRSPLDDIPDEDEEVFYILPKKPINYWEVISRYKDKQRKKRRII